MSTRDLGDTNPRGTRRDADRTIMNLAHAQHCVVTRSQLLAAGVSAEQVDVRLRGHRLRALHRGVYLAGPLLGPLTPEMSAVLACGESAAVSHRSSAALWQMVLVGRDAGAGEGRSSQRQPMLLREVDGRSSQRQPTLLREVDVTVPSDGRRRRPGIRIHRMDLSDDEITILDAIPVTTPARTLYDLAAILAERDLERALAEALARRLTSQAQLEELAPRYQRRAGSHRLRALLGSGEQPARIRSVAEECFLALIAKAQLPAPEVNVEVHGYEVDFFWRTERLVVEIDGFAFHSSRRRFESDRRRDAILAAAGVRVMRVTWRQIQSEPHALLVRLAQALAHVG